MRRAPLAVSFLLLGLLACPAHGTGTGVVEEVVDGDTLRVRTSGNAEAVTVRLIGIDAPERSHPTLGKEFLSDESAAHLASLCRGKTVRMEKDGEETDTYDRLLRYVFLTPSDGRLLNEEMLRVGMARAYTRFPHSRTDAFLAAEADARRKGRGLWKNGGMAEARWLAAGNASPVEGDPPGGGALGLRPPGGGQGRGGQRLVYLTSQANGRRSLPLFLFVKAPPRSPGNPGTDYKGKKVRVRGE